MYVGGGTMFEAYFRTLLLDVDSRTHERVDADTFEALLDSDIPRANEDMMKPRPTEMRRIRLREAEQFDKTLQNAVTNRRLFITTKGYIGLGPSQTEAGDQICIGFDVLYLWSCERMVTRGF
ncbi:hypothetical protein BKA64DRAFT_686843 [Cadophora sp. MPI-SDFR-AT-0126]|nr:hypothetical protein BKA64DRAFT_686843 [Leotiomycetes sp. MPI-SDFR-AT-0126]